MALKMLCGFCFSASVDRTGFGALARNAASPPRAISGAARVAFFLVGLGFVAGHVKRRFCEDEL